VAKILSCGQFIKNKFPRIIFFVIVVFVISSCVYGLAQETKVKAAQVENFEQARNLHRAFEFGSKVTKGGGAQGSAFFLLALGGASYLKDPMDSRYYYSVMIAYETSEGSYAIARIPLERIRIGFDEAQSTPTVKFKLKRTTINKRDVKVDKNYGEDSQAFINTHLAYATLITQKEHWPTDIELPLNKENFRELRN